ncbi:MAG: hypothetical protein WC614_10380 [bacterium]
MKKTAVLFIMLGFITGCVFVPANSGPPSHAKAYGYRAKHTCWYYPNEEVYYLSESRTYAVIDGGNWVVVNAPGRALGSYVVIESETNKPWLRHSEYRGKYSPGQAKGNHGKNK